MISHAFYGETVPLKLACEAEVNAPGQTRGDAFLPDQGQLHA